MTMALIGSLLAVVILARWQERERSARMLLPADR